MHRNELSANFSSLLVYNVYVSTALVQIDSPQVGPPLSCTPFFAALIYIWPVGESSVRGCGKKHEECRTSDVEIRAKNSILFRRRKDNELRKDHE